LELLPDTCNVLGVSRTPDGYGGFTETWGTVTASVKCRLDYNNGNEVIAGGAIQSYKAETMTVPYNVTVTTANVIEYSGAQYNILSVSEGSWLAVKRLSLEKV
jgi:SPP1 family predicted phage head-tail adaptor